MIGRSGEIGSGISGLVARHDDDDDEGVLCKVKTYFQDTAVQCSVCRMWVFAGFSGHGNLINIYIYIYI